MEFSSLVLMEKDTITNEFVREIGSYQVTEGAEYIKNMYYDGQKVNIFFSTLEDVEDWQYHAIYDLLDRGIFEKNQYLIEECNEEYNPTWRIITDLIEDTSNMENKIKNICTTIKNEMNKILNELQLNEEKFKEEYANIEE